jgi:hypothetical protein
MCQSAHRFEHVDLYFFIKARSLAATAEGKIFYRAKSNK